MHIQVFKKKKLKKKRKTKETKELLLSICVHKWALHYKLEISVVKFKPVHYWMEEVQPFQ